MSRLGVSEADVFMFPFLCVRFSVKRALLLPYLERSHKQTMNVVLFRALKFALGENPSC